VKKLVMQRKYSKDIERRERKKQCIILRRDSLLSMRNEREYTINVKYIEEIQ